MKTETSKVCVFYDEFSLLCYLFCCTDVRMYDTLELVLIVSGFLF